MATTSRAGRAALLEDLELRRRAQDPQPDAPERSDAQAAQVLPAANDHFVNRNGMRFAGTHLIIDMWGASNLSDAGIVEAVLRQAAEDAGATLLNIDLHCFTPNGGITGVAVLAESHISIHTWPERSYAAVDVFMCGDAEPYKAIDILREALEPRLLTLSEHRRGVMS